MQPKETSPRLVIVIIVCLYLPFLESMFSATLWGLNWQSPAMMDSVGDYLRIVKFGMVCVAAYLMAFNYQIMQNTIKNGIARGVFVISTLLLVGVQLPMLLMGLIMSDLLKTNGDDEHKEQTFGDKTIYVYTFDPGAMGKAYHHFYLKCPKPLGRYQLSRIETLDWMPNFSINLENEQLIVVAEDGTTSKFDISKISCS